MCGIVGFMGFAPNQVIDNPTLSRMRDTMVHRGPDGADNWIGDDGRVGFGHRRLAIIDLSDAATQPMADAAGRTVVTFNGEIYNHVALRRALEQSGRRFRTDHSDTEVLVEGFGHWGIDKLVENIEGDYAFGIWSAEEEAVYLVRDRAGVKPLYFACGPQGLVFASEIKAILAHPAVEAAAEPIAVYHYLTSMTTPAPLTMFRGVYKLPAGYYLRVAKSGDVRAVRYWDATPGRGIPAGALERMSEADRLEYCKTGAMERLTAAVDKRMMSDVPFGVFLSGGVDSSLNVALMSRFTSEPLRTFTVGFKDHEKLNELHYARMVADRFQTDHREILIDERDMVGYLDQLIYHQDEPIADWVCIPLYFVSKLAHDSGVTVVQVGEGSDEQFCGYDRYLAYLNLHRRYWRPFRGLPNALQRPIAGAARLASRGRPGRQVYADIIDRAVRDRELFWGGAMVFWNLIKDDVIDSDRVSASDAVDRLVDWGLMDATWRETDTYRVYETIYRDVDRAAPGAGVLTRMTYSELKHRLPELLLMRIDKIGMSVSLEARVPFLDHNLIEFTMDIPRDIKIRGDVPKYLLKKAVEDILPHDVIYRKKMGFGAPMAHWMRGEFGGEVERVLMNTGMFRTLPFNREYIRRLIADHREGRAANELYLWNLYNLAAWHDYWIEKPAISHAA